MNIGQRIKNRRKELDLTADYIASCLHKDRSTVYRYEIDEIKKLPTAILEPLAQALDTTPAYLMGWDENADVSYGKINDTQIDQDNIVKIGYNLLDDIDKSIIKGEIRQMLRADKYKGKTAIDIDNE